MNMRLLAALVFGLISLSAGTSQQAKLVHAHELRSLGGRAIGLCLEKIKHVTDKPLSTKADRAYVYADNNLKGISVIFTHGGWGTFGKRSTDYYEVMGCSILRPSMEVVVLDRPMYNPIFYAPGADYFYFGKGSKPTHSMELWYSRELGRFYFVSMQRFSMGNYYRNNPKLNNKPRCSLPRNTPQPATPPTPAWIKKHPGCYSEIQ